MSKQEPSPPTKKPYRTPVLENYGAIKDLTRSIAGTGMNDSMSNNSTKTG